MIPAASINQGPTSQELSQMVLEVDPQGTSLHLALRGDLDPERVLESLRNALEEAPRARRLCLDLSGTTGLNHMALSALIVVLRAQCKRYSRIELRGLPYWARLRLCQSHAEGRLRSDWIEQHGGDWMVFYANTAPDRLNRIQCY